MMGAGTISVDGAARLRALRRFEGTPPEFWKALLAELGSISGAAGVVLLTPREVPAEAPSGEAPAAGAGGWAPRARWPDGRSGRVPLGLLDVMGPVLDRAAEEEKAVAGGLPGGLTAGILSFDTGDPRAPALGAFFFEEESPEKVERELDRLAFCTDIPLSYLSHQSAQKACDDVQALSSTLDLLALLNREDRFVPAAMLVCNELAARLGCRRVSLGWFDRGQVRVRGISHADKFEKKMESVRLLEMAMEECLDQDEELVWPAPPSARTVTRDHESYAAEIRAGALASLPLRSGGETVAVILGERDRPFVEADLVRLRLFADQISRRLSELCQRDRWWGARLTTYARSRAARLVGVEHTWWKVAAMFVAAVFAGLLFFGKTYQVEAPFQVKSVNVVYVTAPFDGYIHEVLAEVGDDLPAGAVLCRFDTRDLLLEHAIASANLARYLREVERARAQQAHADRLIHEARVEQVRADLARIVFRLEQAEIRAPFAATVLEGDLKQKTGAPVSAGNVLYQVARIDNLYVEARVSEADIHLVEYGAGARLAFASQPQQKFPVVVSRIDPVGIDAASGTVFVVRIELPEERAGWWRPGMSGVAKIEAGRHSFAWILTRRTLDYFRLNWWW